VLFCTTDWEGCLKHLTTFKGIFEEIDDRVNQALKHGAAGRNLIFNEKETLMR